MYHGQCTSDEEKAWKQQHVKPHHSLLQTDTFSHNDKSAKSAKTYFVIFLYRVPHQVDNHVIENSELFDYFARMNTIVQWLYELLVGLQMSQIALLRMIKSPGILDTVFFFKPPPIPMRFWKHR